jgi:hypothetical protein
MRMLWKAAAVLFMGIIGLSSVSSAQDEPVPSYATAFDLEQTVENLTVRVLWAWANEAGIEVAWIQTFDPSKPGLIWRSELLHDGVMLHPYLDHHPLSFMPITADTMTFAILKPSGITGEDTVTLELRYTGTRHNNGTPVPDAPEETMSFLLEVPFYHIRRWSGEQTVTVNGVSMTLKAVEYLPSETNLTLCYPRIVGGKRGSFTLEYDPFIDDPDARVSLKAVGDRGGSSAAQMAPPPLPSEARTVEVAFPEVTPEVTDEMAMPTVTPVPPTLTPSPPTSTPTPEKCLDVGIAGLMPDEDGVLQIHIDELRTDIIPTAENVPIVNAALEQIRSPWHVSYDASNGLGFGAAGYLPTGPHFHHWRVFWNILSDIMSERLLGPWTFSVPLE